MTVTNLINGYVPILLTVIFQILIELGHVFALLDIEHYLMVPANFLVQIHLIMVTKLYVLVYLIV